MTTKIGHDVWQGRFDEMGRDVGGTWLLPRALFEYVEMKPTLSELRDAIPQRGTGAPASSRSHYEAILELLRKRGPQGVLGSELYARPGLYGRFPRNRISELRRDGHLIEGKPHGRSDWFYRLIRDNAGVTLLSDSPDWFERQMGKPRPSGKPPEQSADLPLFATVQP